jgi:hypothetical protein
MTTSPGPCRLPAKGLMLLRNRKSSELSELCLVFLWQGVFAWSTGSQAEVAIAAIDVLHGP